MHDAQRAAVVMRLQLPRVAVRKVYYLRRGGYVMPGVCLLATLRKTTERIFTKILPQMYLYTTKNWLNFGHQPPPDPAVPGISRMIL